MKCAPSSVGRACICTFAASDHAARNICLSVDLRRIEVFVQKFAEFSECIIQLSLLGRRNTRIRHHPIGNEMSLEQPLGETQRLRTCKKQLLSLLNLFLALRVEFVHSVRLEKRRDEL